MRIKRVEIINFRCLDKVNIEFDEITTFIGPNGAGKSSVLRALDWFFNGEKSVSLSLNDVFSGSEEANITVKVEFDQLSAKDREVLGSKYAPEGVNELTVWRIWEDGKDKITGRALAYPPFEAVRAGENATERKKAYSAVIKENSGIQFPVWTNDGAAEQMMAEWEREHNYLLEASTVSGTNFFGFAGQGILSGLFDFVLITADMRAAEESQDNKNSVIGRILEKAVDRSVAEQELMLLSEELTKQHEKITDKYFTGQLKDLSSDITREVTSFAPGRIVEIASVPAEFRPQTTKFKVIIDDHGTKTDVERQGHGFQRSLLIAALKLLAERGSARADKSVILLSIEEPELFQHPTQAKAFANVLRALATDSDNGIQVAYATHSPYFVEPTYFDQIRRVERNVKACKGVSQVIINHASMDGVITVLSGAGPDDDAVRRRLDNSCLGELRDSLFASFVLLLEGPTDGSIYEGIADSTTPLSALGIEVACASSKYGIYLPAAILKQLGIKFFTVFDSDSGSGQRIRNKGGNDAESNATRQELADATSNKALLKFFGEVETDWPTGIISDRLAVLDDNIETILENWQEFEQERLALISAKRGSEGKNSATYRLAARGAINAPASLSEIIDKIKILSTN